MILCRHTESLCCRTGTPASPVGIVIHSTGVNNPYLKRYVQPSRDDPDRPALLAVLGENKNGNSWNRSVTKAVHYMIGKLADGTVETVSVLPETICAWGVGKGKKGSYNYNPTAHIQFEICEDGLADKSYFQTCYREAVALCADICRRHGWGVDVIVSHREAALRGYASNHADIDHWLKKFGLSMNDLRADVGVLLSAGAVFRVGQTVAFSGRVQYRSSGALGAKKAEPCRAVIKRIYRPEEARHPYLIRGAGVYGWVDRDTIVPV